MGGLIKLFIGFFGAICLIEIAVATEDIPAWAQLLAYSLIVAGWIAHKDD